MKKNAVLIAGIMFVAAGCASSEGQRASRTPIYDNPSSYDRADVRVSSTEVTASNSPGSTASHSYGSDISADSSKRGGSLDARGYHQDANNNEIEPTPDPINPGKQADSSVRGGSIFAREREWNDDSEPSSAQPDQDRHLKADSSIRGGSIEARGGREAGGNYESSDLETNVEVEANTDSADSDLRSSYESGSRDDFGQGSSATRESGKAHGSLRGSANWNASDDLLRDGVSDEATSTAPYEINNDASVGGAARSESGTGNSTDTDSSLHRDVEAAGASASTEVRTSSSSTLDSTDSKFESNDPAMKKPGSPLGVAGGEPNFHYQDNRAHGVGSATSGDFATAPVNQNIEIGKSDLAQKVKGRLTRESTGTHGLMRHGVARNIQVSAQGNDVTLTGTVPSQKDKEMIEIRTREIAGVHRVNNQLIVTPEAEAAHRNVTRGSDLEDVTSEIQD